MKLLIIVLLVCSIATLSYRANKSSYKIPEYLERDIWLLSDSGRYSRMSDSIKAALSKHDQP